MKRTQTHDATVTGMLEPVFHAACRLNRMARKGGRTAAESARSDLTALLAEAASHANAAGLADRFDAVAPAVCAFIDDIVRDSGVLEPGTVWRLLAEERPLAEGGFFAVARSLLDAPDSVDTRDRIEVVFTCLGLGYTGELRGRPDELRGLMADLSARISGRLAADRATRIVPEAYDNVDSSDLVEPPARGVVGMAVAMVAMAAVVIAGNAYFYQAASRDLRDALTRVEDSAGTAAPASDSRDTLNTLGTGDER